MPDPMDTPPADHGSDRYDYVEVEAPKGVRPVGLWWDALIVAPCPDCAANVFAKFTGNVPADMFNPASWYITLAHDEMCPAMTAMENPDGN